MLEDDDIGKVIYCDKDFKIINTRNEFILVNRNGEYHNHCHLKKESTCYLLMKIVKRRQLPRSTFLLELEAARRLTVDEAYLHEIELKQKKKKQKYVNSQKGVRK